MADEVDIGTKGWGIKEIGAFLLEGLSRILIGRVDEHAAELDKRFETFELEVDQYIAQDAIWKADIARKMALI